MNRLFTLIVLLMVAMSTMAQQSKYTDYLQRQVSGRGVVVLHQDADLENLVNGISATTTKRGNIPLIGETSAIEDDLPPVAPSGRHTTASGFRVQVISLGSSAKDKATAEAWGRKFKGAFPGINVYVSYRSPHYVCRVGDYRTREEASEMLQQMRATGQFGSASIVRCSINVYY